MRKRRLLILAVCLTICLGLCAVALAATIPSGQVKYWDYHSLEGQIIQPGFDIYGHNFEARIFNGYGCNLWGKAWSHCPPLEGDRTADWWQLERWNEAFLGTQDYDGDGYLDWQPFTDRDHYWPPEDWQGSGAVVSWDGWVQGSGTRFQWTLAAAPADAWCVVEQPYGCDCAVWYDAAGNEIGWSTNNAPCGDRLQWILVDSVVHCDGHLVCNYHNQAFSPDLGKM